MLPNGERILTMIAYGRLAAGHRAQQSLRRLAQIRPKEQQPGIQRGNRPAQRRQDSNRYAIAGAAGNVGAGQGVTATAFAHTEKGAAAGEGNRPFPIAGGAGGAAGIGVLAAPAQGVISRARQDCSGPSEPSMRRSTSGRRGFTCTSTVSSASSPTEFVQRMV